MANLKIKIGATPQELKEAQRLRFEIFNLEMGVGSQSSYTTGLDQDEFDDICDHLLIIDTISNQIVGTYRLLPDTVAEKHQGYYSEKRFNLDKLLPLIDDHALEVGRSCIRKEYRGRPVLNLMWQGIAGYCIERKIRYIFGTPSLTTQDTQEVNRYLAMLKQLNYYEDRGVRPAAPENTLQLSEDLLVENPKELYDRLSPLFKGYLDMGAKVCGHPALNKNFGTTVFFIVVDLKTLNPRYRKRFLGNYLKDEPVPTT